MPSKSPLQYTLLFVRTLSQVFKPVVLGYGNVFTKLSHDVGMYYQECCEDEHEHVSSPAACEPFMRPDIHRPFSAKHGLQQASILGNMQDYGLLEVSSKSINCG